MHHAQTRYSSTLGYASTGVHGHAKQSAPIQQIDGYEASASASQYERGVVQQQLDSAMVAEDDRVRTVAAYAEELSKRQPSTPERPLQCTSERSACVKCYEDAINNKKLPTECAQFVDAFAKCAASVQKDFVSRGMPTP